MTQSEIEKIAEEYANGIVKNERISVQTSCAAIWEETRDAYISGALSRDKEVEELRKDVRVECIAYNNWLTTLNKDGYPKNENGTSMNCWELFDHYSRLEKSEGGLIRDTYVNHANQSKNKY